MTELLTKALRKASKLPAEVQDDLAKRLLEDLAGVPRPEDSPRIRDRAVDRALSDWTRRGWLTPAEVASHEPPPSLPVARLDEVLDELEGDRDER